MTAKYREILAAAARVIRAKGYHATTVRDIAQAAGLGKGSLYHHIESKQQLLEEILLQGMDLLLPTIREIQRMDVEAAVKVEAALVCHVNAFARNEDVVTVFIRESPQVPAGIKHSLVKALAEYREGWSRILDQGKAEGLFHPDLPNSVVLNGIFGMCNWIYRWYVPGKALTLSEVGRVFSHMVLHGICLPAGARRTASADPQP